MLKTNKALSKRIKVTGGKKLLRRVSGQDHFNAKERGKNTRRKRHMREMAGIPLEKIRRRLPSAFS